MTDVFDKENIAIAATSIKSQYATTKSASLTTRSINHINTQHVQSSSSIDKTTSAIQQMIRKPLSTMTSNNPPLNQAGSQSIMSLRRPGLQAIFTKPMGSAQRVQADEQTFESDDEDDNNHMKRTSNASINQPNVSMNNVTHSHINMSTSNQSNTVSLHLSNQHLNVHVTSPNQSTRTHPIRSPRRSIGHTNSLSSLPITQSIDHPINRSLCDTNSHQSVNDQTVMTPPSSLPVISIDSASPASQSSDSSTNPSLSSSTSTPLSSNSSTSVNSSNPTVELDLAVNQPIHTKPIAVRQLQLNGNRMTASSHTHSTHLFNQSNPPAISQPALRSSPAKHASTLNTHPTPPIVPHNRYVQSSPGHGFNHVMTNNMSQNPVVKLNRNHALNKSNAQSSHSSFTPVSSQSPRSSPLINGLNNHSSSISSINTHLNNQKSTGPPNHPPTGNAAIPSNSKPPTPQVFIVKERRFETLGPPLGKGGTSVVYRVVSLDSTSNNTYALKVVQLPVEAQALVNLENEIRMLEKMKDCNQCIKLYAYEIKNESPRVLYMVMELGKEDLSQWMQRTALAKEQLDPIRLREVWRSMLQCVAVCHENKILHRDLKPANFVFVGIDVKILDFGIAASMGEAETNATCVVSEHMMGTLNYMSPESLSAEFVDRKYRQHRASDVWSLGCILYQLVYGSSPFHHFSNVMGKMRAICDVNYRISFPLVDLHNRPVSKHLLDVMKSSLQYDPAKRASIESLLKHPFINIDAACNQQQICIDKSRLATMLAKRGIMCTEPELDAMFEELR